MVAWLEGAGLEDGSKKPVKNQDLWQRLDNVSRNHDINWHWIKGHSGHRENEIADGLANKAIDEMQVS